MTRSLLIAALTLLCCGCGKATVVVSSIHHRTCPHVDEHNAPSSYPATRSVLVPGHPYAFLVCRYWGSQDQGQRRTFAGERYVTDTEEIASFVRKLDALKPPRREPRAPHRIFCGEDLALGGRSVLLLFRYSNAPDDPVRISIANCIPVSNGHLRAFRFGTPLELGEHWPDEGAL
jgi:hypothetical protein